MTCRAVASVLAASLLSAFPARAQQCIPQPVAGAEAELFKDMLLRQRGQPEAAALANAGIAVECATSPLLYCPDCLFTRGQLAVFLAGAAGLALIEPTAPTYSDVPTTSPQFAAIETMTAAGLIGGCNATMFCPTLVVTRVQLARYVVAAAGLPIAPPPNPSFIDVSPSSSAYGSIEALAEVCPGAGCSCYEFCPSHAVDRAEAAIIIAHAFGLWDANVCISYWLPAGARGGSGGAGGFYGTCDGFGAFGGSPGGGGSGGAGGGQGTGGAGSTLGSGGQGGAGTGGQGPGGAGSGGQGGRPGGGGGGAHGAGGAGGGGGAHGAGGAGGGGGAYAGGGAGGAGGSAVGGGAGAAGGSGGSGTGSPAPRCTGAGPSLWTLPLLVGWLRRRRRSR